MKDYMEDNPTYNQLLTGLHEAFKVVIKHRVGAFIYFVTIC